MKIPQAMNNTEINLIENKTPDKNEKRSSDPVGSGIQATEESNFPHYKRVSDYLLGTCVGEGSFAKVRVGFHCPTKEKVAIKIINKAKAKRDSYVFRNLHREGKIMQRLRHPNIVQVFDILETGNNYYLVTELCNGGELIDIVTEQGSLPEDLVRKYTCQLVDAVAYMHERRIVHRDLKVENLLLDSRDNLKIIDFGLSNVLPDNNSDSQFALSTQCGSPAYAAPELLAKKSYGPKVDVWSIGVITYALLVGKLPFTVEPFNIPKLGKKMMKGDMNPIPSFISSQCRVFIRKLLSPDQTHRPAVSDAIKLKWIAAYKDANTKPTKSSVPSLLIDRFAGESYSRRHVFSIPSSSQPIDSSIVKEMNALYGFTCSDIIQCVHKNRPGPALATYHLLLRRKKLKTYETENLKFVQAISNRNRTEQTKVESRQQTPKQTIRSSMSENADDNSTEDCDSAELFEDDLTVTPPLKSTISEKAAQTFLSKKRRQPTSERKNERNFKDNYPSPNNKTPLQKTGSSKFTLSPTIDFRTSISTNSSAKSNCNDVKASTLESKERAVNSEEVKFVQTAISETSEKLSTVQNTTAAKKPTEINELLASMRQAREALETRQKLQQRNRLNVINVSSRVKSPTAHHHGTKDEVAGQNTPKERSPKNARRTPFASPKSLRPGTLQYSFPQERSASQQESRQPEEFLKHYSPLTRPASHNVVLTRRLNSVQVPKRYVYTPTSSSKAAHEEHFEKSIGHKNYNQTPPKDQSGSSTLPMIAVKPQARHPVSGKPSGESPFIRISLPASSRLHPGNHRRSLRASDDKSDLFINEPKSFDTKLSIPLKWHKTSSSKENCDDKKKYGHVGRISHTTHRPRKVISEPIAAAISYLTSSKHRAIRKERVTPLSTS